MPRNRYFEAASDNVALAPATAGCDVYVICMYKLNASFISQQYDERIKKCAMQATDTQIYGCL